MQSHCDQIAISWHEARNRSTCRLWHSFFTGVRRVSSKSEESSQQQDQRETIRPPRSWHARVKSTPRARKVERDRPHVSRTAADTARSSRPWIRARWQLLVFPPKRGLQVHEALGIFFSASRGRNMVSSIASGRQSGARHQDESLWALEERGFVMRQSPSTTRHFQAGEPSFSWSHVR